MKEKRELSVEEMQEQISLYVLDALPADERAALEENLREVGLEAELRSLQEVAGQLGYAAQPVDPPPSLRERLVNRVAELPGSSEVADSAAKHEAKQPGILFHQSGLLISRSAELNWEPAPLPGISSKVLFHDPGRNYTTQLVRMDPGITYPSHHHKDVEELYLLEGDLLVEGQRMLPGDYCCAEPESVHGPVSTENGALFIVRSSQRDELILT